MNKDKNLLRYHNPNFFGRGCGKLICVDTYHNDEGMLRAIFKVLWETTDCEGNYYSKHFNISIPDKFYIEGFIENQDSNSDRYDAINVFHNTNIKFTLYLVLNKNADKKIMNPESVPLAAEIHWFSKSKMNLLDKLNKYPNLKFHPNLKF